MQEPNIADISSTGRKQQEAHHVHPHFLLGNLALGVIGIQKVIMHFCPDSTITGRHFLSSQELIWEAGHLFVMLRISKVTKTFKLLNYLILWCYNNNLSLYEDEENVFY